MLIVVIVLRAEFGFYLPKFLFIAFLLLLGKHVCNSEANCTWNDAIVMSETVMIDIEMDKELIQNWNIHVQIKRFIFLRFAMFDIGCQSGSVLELEFSSTDTHSLCNTNKPIVGLNSTSNILKITFTFQKRPNRVIEGFKADYIARKIPRLSPSLITHEEQGNCVVSSKYL